MVCQKHTKPVPVDWPRPYRDNGPTRESGRSPVVQHTQGLVTSVASLIGQESVCRGLSRSRPRGTLTESPGFSAVAARTAMLTLCLCGPREAADDYAVTREPRARPEGQTTPEHADGSSTVAVSGCVPAQWLHRDNGLTREPQGHAGVPALPVLALSPEPHGMSEREDSRVRT